MSFREIKEAVDQQGEAQRIFAEEHKKRFTDLEAKHQAEIDAVKSENLGLRDRLEELESRGPVKGLAAAPTNLFEKQFAEFFSDDDVKRIRLGKAGTAAFEFKGLAPLLLKDASFIGGDGYVGSPASGYPVQAARLAGINDIRRPLDLLSRIPTVSPDPMPSNTLEFVRLGTESYAAGIQSQEGAAKSQVEYSFVLDSVPVRTYAGYAIASKQVLDDAASLRSFLQERLAFDVRSLLEQQVVTGSSSAVSGIAEEATAYSGSQTTAADRVGGAITSLRARVSGELLVLMNPVDWFAIASEKATTNEYVAGGWAQPADPRLWNVPVAISASVTENTAFVFATQATKLWVRDAINVQLGFINDQFVRNQVTLLAELRAAFAIVQPSLILSVAV